MDTPFVVGARVLVSGHVGGVKETTVSKVYKGGNVILDGFGASQWRPMGDAAHLTGAAYRYNPMTARAFTPENTAQLNAELVRARLGERWAAAIRIVERVKLGSVTKSMVEGIEAVAAEVKRNA